MAITGITALGVGMRCCDDPKRPVDAMIRQAIAAMPVGAPIVILVHGFRYNAGDPACDPHQKLFGTSRIPAKTGWADGLGFNRQALHDGLCIGFGWAGTAEAGMHPLTALCKFSHVYARAAATGADLADLVNLLGRIDPSRQVDILAHSLGARVVFHALRHLAFKNLGRVLLLGAAEYVSDVDQALAVNHRNPEAEFLNFTARENLPFELLFEYMAPRARPGDRVLSAHRSPAARNWVNIQIDHPATIGWLTKRGVRVSTRQIGVTHWGFYLRDGIFDLYRELIRRRHAWDLAKMKVEIADFRQRFIDDRRKTGWTIGQRARL